MKLLASPYEPSAWEDLEDDSRESLDRVLQGDPAAEIRLPRDGHALRPIGLAKGEFVVPDDFDDPLPEDVLHAFEGK